MKSLLDKKVKYVKENVFINCMYQFFQILPAFIIELDAETCQAQFSEWNRETPTPLDAVTYRDISSSKVSAQEHFSVDASYSSKTKYEIV